MKMSAFWAIALFKYVLPEPPQTATRLIGFPQKLSVFNDLAVKRSFDFLQKIQFINRLLKLSDHSNSCLQYIHCPKDRCRRQLLRTDEPSKSA